VQVLDLVIHRPHSAPDMALIEISKRCDDCETSRALLRDVKADLGQMRLDYESLYDKVRTNLAKLAKRARVASEPEEEAPTPTLVEIGRRALALRKLGGSNAVRSE